MRQCSSLRCWLPIAVLLASLAFLQPVNAFGVSLVDENGKVKAFQQIPASSNSVNISYGHVCPSRIYDHLFQMYTFTLPLTITISPMKRPGVGLVSLTNVNVRTKDVSLGSGVFIRFELLEGNSGALVFMIDSQLRYREMETMLFSNPIALQRALKFTVSGRINNVPFELQPIASSNVPLVECPKGNWVLFQRRVDSRLSFAQNWNTYEKGFGDPDRNYWIGLEHLFYATAFSINSKLRESRCRVRIDVTDFEGNRHVQEWRKFQVLDASQNYRLILSHPVKNSTKLYYLGRASSNQIFSTYDLERVQCSKAYGFAGWWFAKSRCHNGLPNGVYPVSVADNNPAKMVLFDGKQFIPLKHSAMLYNCIV